MEVAHGDGRAVSPSLLRTLLWTSVKVSAVGVAVSLETLKELADQADDGAIFCMIKDATRLR